MPNVKTENGAYSDRSDFRGSLIKDPDATFSASAGKHLTQGMNGDDARRTARTPLSLAH
jgi:hypothetical protein